MRHMDLFSGIGGFALAASWVWSEEHKIVTFCEKEEFPRRVLKKHWPDVPCCDDVCKLKGGEYGAIDLITGGFPCQPFSVAGKKAGKKDDRYLWPETLRIIQEAKPRWFVGENVPGIVNLALDEVLTSLESSGYSTEAFIIPACAVNVPHRRDRVWIVAHNISPGCEDGLPVRKIKGLTTFRQFYKDDNEYVDRRGEILANKPFLSRKCYGLSMWMDRFRAIGNAIVPQVAAVIMAGIKEVDRVYNKALHVSKTARDALEVS